MDSPKSSDLCLTQGKAPTEVERLQGKDWLYPKGGCTLRTLSLNPKNVPKPAAHMVALLGTKRIVAIIITT